MVWFPLVALASHFSMVGFDLNAESAAAMGAGAQSYLDRCEPIQLGDRSSVCVVRDATGAELWIGLRKLGNGQAELTTLNPAFAGDGRAAIIVDGDISPAEWKPFEVRIQARLQDDIPIILDLADPREASRFARGAAVIVDITAFADEISFYEDETAYYSNQSGKEIKFASNYFVPSGMFSGEEAASVPTSNALFAGKIIKSELRRNDKGRGSYWFFLVQTLDALQLNVVADPEDVKAAPQVGSYIDGRFWLSARLAKP